METIEIKIKSRDFPRLKKILEKIDFLQSYKVMREEIDEVSMVAEKSLAEEWNSDEDSRWDEFL
ncbi:MAG TPA: hypothetical protein VJ919_06975 [Tangfeifania sp.]|nr:hypothetical protein [Tangfeifania sp.]